MEATNGRHVTYRGLLGVLSALLLLLAGFFAWWSSSFARHVDEKVSLKIEALEAKYGASQELKRP